MRRCLMSSRNKSSNSLNVGTSSFRRVKRWERILREPVKMATPATIEEQKYRISPIWPTWSLKFYDVPRLSNTDRIYAFSPPLLVQYTNSTTPILHANNLWVTMYRSWIAGETFSLDISLYIFNNFYRSIKIVTVISMHWLWSCLR